MRRSLSSGLIRAGSDDAHPGKGSSRPPARPGSSRSSRATRREVLLLFVALLCVVQLAWMRPSHASSIYMWMRGQTEEPEPGRPALRHAYLPAKEVLAGSPDACADVLQIPRVALLFLTTGHLHHETAWKLWFKSAGGVLPAQTVATSVCKAEGASRRLVEAARVCKRNSTNPIENQHLFSVYIHAPPIFPGYHEESLWAGRLVQHRVTTSWGAHTLVEATRHLLWEAFRDPLNTHFVLLSESDIPLYDPLTMWQQLQAETRSRVDTCKHQHTSPWRWDPRMEVSTRYLNTSCTYDGASEVQIWGYTKASTAENTGANKSASPAPPPPLVTLFSSLLPFFPSLFSWLPRFPLPQTSRMKFHHWRKSPQWVGLTRQHVDIVLRDEEIFRRFERHCWSSWDAAHSRWHRDCFSDEHYFATLLSVEGKDKEGVCESRGVSYTDWEDNSAHPRSFAPAAITTELVKKARAAPLSAAGHATPECDWKAAYAQAQQLFLPVSMALSGQSVDACSKLWGNEPYFTAAMPDSCFLMARKFGRDSRTAVRDLFLQCGAEVTLLRPDVCAAEGGTWPCSSLWSRFKHVFGAKC